MGATPYQYLDSWYLILILTTMTISDKSCSITIPTIPSNQILLSDGKGIFDGYITWPPWTCPFVEVKTTAHFNVKAFVN